MGKKDGQRRSTENVNLFSNGNQRLGNIGCEPSSKSTDSLINNRPVDRPVSNLSFEKKGKLTSGSNQERLQVVPQPTASILGEFNGEDPKIQVTTEMISKYKMNIVTCEEIEFEGKEGENI